MLKPLIEQLDLSQQKDFVQLQKQYGISVDQVHPLSNNQHAMWFLQQIDPQTTIYNVGYTVHMQVALEPAHMQQALQLLVDRHEVLRTIYPAINGTPVQVIFPQQAVAFDVVEAAGWSESDVAHAVDNFYQRPFNLQLDNVLRARLYKLDSVHFVLQVVVHHIAIDAWSMWLLVDELRQNLAVLRAGARPDLKPLRYQYTNFVQWQSELLAGERGQTLADFWQEELNDAPPTLDLSVKKPSSTTGQVAYDRQQFVIDAALTQKIRALAFTSGTSPYALLLAVFQLLLAKYSGQQDIVVGTPMHGRGSTRFATLIGYCVNLVAMRGDVNPDASFRAFLSKTGAKVQSVALHQHYPFALVTNQQRPFSPNSTQNFIQILFNLIKPPRKLHDLTAVWLDHSGSAQIEMDGMTINRLKVESGYGVYGIDLYLEIIDFEEQLIAKLGYNQTLFESETISQMVTHFCQLLKNALANPDQTLEQLSMLTQAEHEKLLVTWNNTAVAHPTNQFIHTLFSEQAARTPQATAVVFGDQSLTYQELNQRANQLAHHLISRGVGPDKCVGICMQRSIDMLVALLGTLKAGGTYLPLDPAYPQERLAYMLGDAQPVLVLSQANIAAEILSPQDSNFTKLLTASEIVCLDTQWSQIVSAVTDDPATINKPQHLAYVIYTSGSTGQPKGVTLPHQTLTNLILWQLQNSQASLGDKTLQFSSLSFDVSCQEIFATLCSGGTLVLVTQTVRQDAASLLHYLVDNRINRLFVPFVALQQIAEAANRYQMYPSSLHEVITAGEQLRIEQSIAEFFQALPACTLVNQYGPTESHVVSAHKLDGPVSEWPLLPPIGRPIANTHIYLLDNCLQPAAIGLPAELYIGGICLARGYLNNSELTAQQFIANPFAKDIPANNAPRLYKTGDLARYLPDGNIEFLGRTDNQVKIRGYRIEPGEIEATLSAHAAVLQTAVTLHTTESNHKQLVAYFVAQPSYQKKKFSPQINTDLHGLGQKFEGIRDNSLQTTNEQDFADNHLPQTMPTTETLRHFLAQKLPDYMLPTTFISLEAMPLTPSGKIDRKALPAPDNIRPEIAQPYVPPRMPLEQMLANIWAAVLQLEQVGIYDNFFDLGGHSLLATQVISRIEKATRVLLPLRTLFENPTIATLSVAIDQARPTTTPSPPPILPIPRDGEIPLSFAQERLWFLQQLAPLDHAYHIPITLFYRQAINLEILQNTFDALVVRHESLRTIFPTTDGVPRQDILPIFTISIETIDLSTVPAGEQETAVIQHVQADIKRTFELATAPPWRFTLFQLSTEAYIFYFAFHHIIFDQWSIVLLWQELHTLYHAYLHKKTPTLATIDILYADFSVWQRKWLQGSVLAELLTYWRDQLADLPVLDLPIDHPRPPIQTFNGAAEILHLPPALTAALHKLSRQAQVTPFMLMMAAFKLLLARYCAQTDIAVGVPVANRNYLAVEPIIGTFVNTLVIRSDLSDDPPFTQLLERVRNVLLDAYAHQELPFEKLVSEIVTTRDLSHTPLVQVLFNMTNAPFDYAQIAASPITIMPFDRGAAQFDLSLTVVLEPHLPVEPQLIVEYNTSLFEQDSIQRFVAHYITLLSAITADPQLPISRYKMLSSVEQKLLITEWNQTQMAYPRHCLHTLFVEQAQRSAQKTAVTYNNQSLTYQELDVQSNQLAQYLQSLGVGPETIVGLFVERSLEMVVGLLGILKAGAAFLPLDPAFPAERLAFMVADAQVKVILTQKELLSHSPLNHAAHTVCLDGDWPQIAKFPPEPLPQTAVATNLAYVIYTSGSTGKPKGVQIEHRNVVNFMTAMQQQPGISPDDILLSVTTLSFDIAILEIFLPLLNGAQVVLVDRKTAVDGHKLKQAIQQVGATILQATPTTWSMLINAGWHNTPTLQKTLCGGEALPRELAQAILDRNITLWNMYGPTETTIWSSMAQILPSQSRISIGRPIGNNTFYVLDPAGQPVPPGVPGELYIGGDGVARGYINRPELNAAHFLPDPFTHWSSSGLMYRSGDLVRYLADGKLDYLGRLDSQVKIRGQRIELGEIEATLAAHPHIREVIVTVHNSQNEPILVAYIVGHGVVGYDMVNNIAKTKADRPTNTELRSFLRRQLPDYMIPAAFVYLDKFPLTPNRKINRKALPSPDTAFSNDLGYTAPRDHVEQLLVSIWQDVLQSEPISIHDDFFALGGNSLTAVYLFAQLEKRTGKELPLTTLFVAPTVAELAARLKSDNWQPDYSVLVPIQPLGHKSPFYYVAPFTISVLELNAIGSHFEERPFFGIQPFGLKQGEEIHDTIEAMAAHYVTALRRIQPHGPYYLGGHCSGSWVAFEMATQLDQMGETVAYLALVDNPSPTFEEPGQGSLRHIIKRLSYYFDEGRLADAVRWQIKLLAEKWFLLRYGTAQQKRMQAVRNTHHIAYKNYRPQHNYGGPMTLIISSDNIKRYVSDNWYTQWLNLTTHEVEIIKIHSTHALLVFEPQAEQLAKQIIASLE